VIQVAFLVLLPFLADCNLKITNHHYADLSQMARLRGAATTPIAETIDPKVRLQGFSPKNAAAPRPIAA
jgi:hypothetical protein